MVVRTPVTLSKTEGLGIRDLTELASNVRVDNALLVFDDTDLQALILRLEDDLVTVQAVEGLSCVLAGYARAELVLTRQRGA